MRTNEEYKNLEAAKDATIAQQAEQLAALTLALENSENRHVFEAPEGMCFMPENTPEQLEALAEQCEKMRTVISKSRELVCAGAGCGFNPLSGNWADELFSNQAKLTEALALPDIATPALNRIRAEGMLEAAEICKEMKYSNAQPHHYEAAILARAAELGKTK